jgi:hypothetical protein
MSESGTALLVADYLRRGGKITKCPTVNTKDELRQYQWGGSFSTELGSEGLDEDAWFEWIAGELSLELVCSEATKARLPVTCNFARKNLRQS